MTKDVTADAFFVLLCLHSYQDKYGNSECFFFGYSYLLGLKTLLQHFNWPLKEAVLICRVTLMCNVIDHNYPVIHRRSDTSIFLREKNHNYTIRNIMGP